MNTQHDEMADETITWIRAGRLYYRHESGLCFSAKMVELAESMRDACKQLSLALDMAIRKYDTTGSSINRGMVRRQLMHEAHKEMIRSEE